MSDLSKSLARIADVQRQPAAAVEAKPTVHHRNLKRLIQGSVQEAVAENDGELLRHLRNIGMGLVGEIKRDKMGGPIYCETPVKDQVKAIETLLKFSVPPAKDITWDDVNKRLLATRDVLEELLPEELYFAVMQPIHKIWT